MFVIIFHDCLIRADHDMDSDEKLTEKEFASMFQQLPFHAMGDPFDWFEQPTHTMDKEEFAGRFSLLGSHFKEIDADADEKVTLMELETFLAGRAKYHFEKADEDKDGSLTYDEFLIVHSEL